MFQKEQKLPGKRLGSPHADMLSPDCVHSACQGNKDPDADSPASIHQLLSGPCSTDWLLISKPGLFSLGSEEEGALLWTLKDRQTWAGILLSSLTMGTSRYK